ncbi:MAG: hypothetical protein RLZZ618_3708 [Pseudomonadota bacterium]
MVSGVLDPFEAEVLQLAGLFNARGWRLSTAESCTGGLIAAACTAVAGSSTWFERGVVTYSNDAKHELLDVPMDLIERHGAVSEEVARAMAEGALRRSPADVAVSITGVAGPGGGSRAKPVGTVWMGLIVKGQPCVTSLMTWSGDRAAVREQTVREVLRQLLAV